MNLRMRARGNSIIFTVIFLTLFFYSYPSWSDTPCMIQKVTERFLGQFIEVNQIHTFPNGKQEINLSEVFNSKDVVTLGIYPGGHIYLNVGKIRYDGQTFLFLGKIRNDFEDISNSFIIQIKNLKKETIEHLKTQLEAQKNSRLRTLSCYHGKCEQLKKSGLYIGNSDRVYLPSQLFEEIFKKGIVDENGAPYTLEFYRTNQTSLKEISWSIKSSEYLLVAGGGGLILSIGTTLYLHFHLKKDQGLK